MQIIPVQQPGAVPVGPSKSPAESPGPSFTHVLQDAVDTVNQLQHGADAAAKDFALGQAESVHQTMIALTKADLSFRLLTQVRNKAVEAYHEVMRMQM